ncbi:MFS transporter [Blastococcus deserti]|uniref:MFS transporter n=1 Tax=Blastococcus deserti TaxID=2259033 RepID=A0ABW4X8L7_9ACTN
MTGTASRSSPRPLGRRGGPTRLLLPICLTTALVPLNSTMVAVALPDLARDLQAGPGGTLSLVISYLVVTAAVQPVAGSLGDRWGRRAPVLGGAAAFGLLSVAAAAAASLPVLVLLRCLQAAAGATALPNAMALVRETLPEDQRGRALGQVGAAATLAAAAGPPIGGLLTAAAGWPLVFLVNGPLALAAVLAGRHHLPRTAPVRSGRFDVAGALLLLAGLGGGSALLAVRPSGTTLVLGVVAVGSTWLAIIPHELRSPRPVLDPRLFRRRAVSAATVATAASNLALYVLLLAIPVLLGGAYGEAALGLLLLPLLGAFCLLSVVGGGLSDRVGRRAPAVAGLTLLSAPLLWLAANGDIPGIPFLLVSLGLAGAGLGIAQAPVQAAALGAVEPARAGMVSGVWSTSRYLGSITGSAVLAALWQEQPAPRPVFLLAALGAVLSLLAAAFLPGLPRPRTAQPADSTARSASVDGASSRRWTSWSVVRTTWGGIRRSWAISRKSRPST